MKAVLFPTIEWYTHVEAYYQFKTGESGRYHVRSDLPSDDPRQEASQVCFELWNEFDQAERFYFYKKLGKLHWAQRLNLLAFSEAEMLDALKQCIKPYKRNKFLVLQRKFNTSVLEEKWFSKLCEVMGVDGKQALSIEAQAAAEAYSSIRIGQSIPTTRYKNGEVVIGSRWASAPMQIVLPALAITLSSYAFPRDGDCDVLFSFWREIRSSTEPCLSDALTDIIRQACIRWRNTLPIQVPSFHMDCDMLSKDVNEFKLWITQSWNLYGRAGVALRELLLENTDDDSLE